MTLRNSLYISPFSREGEGFRSMTGSANPLSAVGVTQTAQYNVVLIESPGIVYKFFWLNGATVGTDNVQAGLFLSNGTDGGPGTALKLGTSVLSAGANVCQYDDIADTPIAAGVYWLALWESGNTATQFRITPVVKLYGGYREASLTTGLPATATPVALTTGNTPVAGLVMRSAP